MRQNSLAIYVHWPFCLAKCPYCDFNSHVRERVEQDRWRNALLQEIAYYAKELPNREVTSIFFGGGTPSLMPAETVKAIIETIGNHWGYAPSHEITLEANPTSSEAGKFAAFNQAGVNRLSLGIQSLKPESLAFLGRKHSADEARGAIKMARDYFPRYSFDLIYALPNQKAKDWEAELEEALTLAGDHLSLYQLTIEPATPFYYARERSDLKEINDEQAVALYERTQHIMKNSGRPAYEISNHAEAGYESQHNLTYWRYGDYLGIGPGAHGRFQQDNKRYGTIALRSPEKWLEAVEQNGHGIDQQNLISDDEARIEKILMGLRLQEGITLDESILDVLDMKRIEQLEKAGLLQRSNHQLTALPEGKLRLNAVLAEIIKA